MTSLYLVLDMQNDLVHADGPNGAAPLGAQVKSRLARFCTMTTSDQVASA